MADPLAYAPWVVALAGVAAYMWSQHLERQSRERMLENYRKLSESAMQQSRASLAVLAQSKGVSPHVADPAEFTPSGKAWDAFERAREIQKREPEENAILRLKRAAMERKAQHAAVMQHPLTDTEADIEERLSDA